jgi:flavin reductase (DIM6/NTAB) family NADH-FMN oxidoreductase RutF
VDEMTKVGLTPLASERVRPPRVAESAVHMECEMLKTVEVGDGGSGSATVVIGKVLLFHVHAAAVRGKEILIEELRPVSRLGGTAYGLVSGVFRIPRPAPD